MNEKFFGYDVIEKSKKGVTVKDWDKGRYKPANLNAPKKVSKSVNSKSVSQKKK